MSYEVIQAKTLIDLKREVESLLKDGYKLTGGVSHSGQFFYQALYK